MDAIVYDISDQQADRLEFDNARKGTRDFASGSPMAEPLKANEELRSLHLLFPPVRSNLNRTRFHFFSIKFSWLYNSNGILSVSCSVRGGSNSAQLPGRRPPRRPLTTSGWTGVVQGAVLKFRLTAQ